MSQASVIEYDDVGKCRYLPMYESVITFQQRTASVKERNASACSNGSALGILFDAMQKSVSISSHYFLPGNHRSKGQIIVFHNRIQMGSSLLI